MYKTLTLGHNFTITLDSKIKGEKVNGKESNNNRI